MKTYKVVFIVKNKVLTVKGNIIKGLSLWFSQFYNRFVVLHMLFYGDMR